MKNRGAYRQIIAYLFFGGATTLVNLLLFMFTKEWLNVYFANFISWFGSVLFAYFTNKYFVFGSTTDHKEVSTVGKFFFYRVLSLGIDMGCMVVFIQYWHWLDNLAKISTQIIVVLLNYFFSKYLIFKKTKDH